MVNSISVIGLGKLGGTMAACFAAKNYNVIGYDVNDMSVDALNNGLAPVYENGLQDLINLNKSRILGTKDLSFAINNTEISFVVVPTPSRSDGSFSLDNAVIAMEQIGAAISKKSDYHVVVLTSTVLPGSSRGVLIPAIEKYSKKKFKKDFGYCYNPEFIALGSVIKDFYNPDFYLVGTEQDLSFTMISEIHNRVSDNKAPIKKMSIESAELAKISLNSFVTMKISFANILAQFSEKIENCDVDTITNAIGLDKRIGSKYLTGGLGFGGPCFPRDNVAMNYMGSSLGIDTQLLEANHKFNNLIPNNTLKFLEKYLSIKEKITVLGLAYKPLSDVIDGSQGIEICRILLNAGYTVSAYDPLSMENAARVLGKKITFHKNINESIKDSSVVIITTDDPAFYNIDFEEIISKGNNITVIDFWRKFNFLKHIKGIKYIPYGVYKN